MIDLTKYLLKELQNKIKKTVGGDDVEIYAIHKDQEYPILGSRLDGGQRIPDSWKNTGEYIRDNKYNLCLSAFTPEIDYNQLPVDTLIEVEGLGKRYTACWPLDDSNLVRFYDEGSDSNTGSIYISINKKKCKLITNSRKGWFGGEVGIPDGVKLRVWEVNTNGSALISTNYIAIMQGYLRDIFDSSGGGLGITSYQILGEDYKEGDEL